MRALSACVRARRYQRLLDEEEDAEARARREKEERERRLLEERLRKEAEEKIRQEEKERLRRVTHRGEDAPFHSPAFHSPPTGGCVP